MNELTGRGGFEVVGAAPVGDRELHRAHNEEYVKRVAEDYPLYRMAVLAAGGAVRAALIATAGEPAFACVRPPGHHASRSSGWGYCAFNNLAVSLLKLREEGLVGSAFVMDIDAHKGDGTIDILKGWEELSIVNPFAGDGDAYVAECARAAAGVKSADVVAVSAGFDGYERDTGGKLKQHHFYEIGILLKRLTSRLGHSRRFAVLEGGYYLPDLGTNVLNFCQGFQ